MRVPEAAFAAPACPAPPSTAR